MNRVFLVLVLLGAGVALGLDLFGAPLEVAPGAVVDANADATVRDVERERESRGRIFTLEDVGDGALRLTGGREAARVDETAPLVAAGDGRFSVAFSAAGVRVHIGSEREVTPAALAAGLARLGTLREAGPHPAPRLQKVTGGLVDMASTAAKLALGLIGILALWMGVLRVAEAAGLVKSLARLLRPVLVRLFPDVPADHPAMGAMLMNIAANMLGLGNAATPLGLEAMRQLQTLNVNKQTATNAMCLFLALNTSGLTLIPARTIALRAENGSVDPTRILLPTLVATLCATVVAVVVARLLAPRFPVVPAGEEDAAGTEEAAS